jgi:hypothetical protein
MPASSELEIGHDAGTMMVRFGPVALLFLCTEVPLVAACEVEDR